MKRRDMEGETITVGDRTVQLGSSLARDQHGKTYAVQDEQLMAVKIFDNDDRRELVRKTEAMVGNPPNKIATTQGVTLSIQWPHEIVEDTETGTKFGCAIPIPDTGSKKDVLQHAVQNLNWNRSTPNERYEIALNLANIVSAIHQQGHAIGDFNHRHVLIGEHSITVRNCDRFCIQGGDTNQTDTSDVGRDTDDVPVREGPYTNTSGSDDSSGETNDNESTGNAGEAPVVYWSGAHHPRYMPATKRQRTLSDIRQNDRFGLAVHIFQLLMEGEHPFRATGPDAATGSFQDMIKANPFPYDNPEASLESPDQAPEYEQIPDSIRELFSDTFGQLDSQTGEEYPSPLEWVRTLSAAGGFDNSIPERAEASQEESAGHDYISGSQQPSESSEDTHTTEQTDQSDHPDSHDTEPEQTDTWIDKVITTPESTDRSDYSADSHKQQFTVAVERRDCKKCGTTNLRSHHQGCDAPLVYIGSQWQCGACGVNVPASGTCPDCGASVEREAVNIPVDFSPSINPIDIEHAIHKETNQRRAEHGQKQLEYSDHLSVIAHRHSRNMAHQEFFDHTTPDGHSTADRYEQFNHDTKQSGENIALEYPDPTASSKEIAQSIVDGWMNSSGHRENILRDAFEMEGIGIYLKPSGAVYATQNFC